MRRNWTRTEERRLVEMRTANPPLKLWTCAKRLNRTVGSVRQRLHRLGVRTMKPRATRGSGELRPVVKQLLTKGYPVTEIADRLGIGHTYVGVLRKKFGYPPATERQKRELQWKWRRALGKKVPA